MSAAPRTPRLPSDPWDRRHLRGVKPVLREALVQVPGRADLDVVQVLQVLPSLGSLLVDFGTDSPGAVRWVPGSWEVAA